MSGSTMKVALEITASGAQAVTQINGVTQALQQTGAAANQATQSTTAAAAALTQVGQAGATLATLATAAPRAAAGLRDTATAAAAAGREVGITSNQMRQLAPQLNDIATQLALGQSPFMILAAQGGQVTQIFGGVRNTLSALATFLGPGGIAGILGVTAAGFLVTALERDARALNDLSQRLRATRADAASLAREVDEASKNVNQTTGVSRGDARDAGRIIAGQRDFSGDRAEIEKLIRLSADLARVMGTEVPDAAERFVGTAIRDPAAAARTAASGGLLGFNDQLRRQIDLLVAAGDRGTATRLVLEQFGRASTGAAEALTPLQSMVQNLSNVLSQAADAIQRLAQGAAGLGQRLGRSVLDTAPDAPEIPREQWDFARRLSTRESGNRAGIMNQQGYAGLYQFGAARLAGLGLYQPAEGENLRANDWIGRFQIPGFDGVRNIGDFRGNERAQDAAFATHLASIDRAIDALIRERPDVAGLSRDGLRAVAHLGGEGGMRSFVASGATSDPADANGTRLSGYYREFGGQGAAMPGAAVSAGRVTTPATAANRALEGRNLPSDRAREIDGQITMYEGALNFVGRDSQSTEAQRYREELVKLRAELEGLQPALSRANRALGDQFEASRSAAGAARDLTQAEIAARNEARGGGLSPEQTDEMVRLRRRGAEDLQDRAFNDDVARRERDLATQREGLGVLGQGTTAVERNRIAQEARTLALATAEAGTERYNRQVERLTQLLTQQAAIPRVATVLTDQAREREDLVLANDLIGASAGDRAARLARQRTSRQLGAAADTPDGQRALDSADSLARNRIELERSQATYNELGRIGEQAFDRIGQAVTSGTLNLKTLGDAGRAVASELTQAFLRLAIINPFKNALLGGNSPTISDVGGGLFSRLLGGVFGGAGGGVSSTAGSLAGSSFTSAGVPILHTGGIVGHDSLPMRAVNDNIFANARRYHTGGMIGADEVPAILQRGEGVFTAEQMARLGPAGGQAMTINMPIQFSGDSGSDADRAGLLALVDQRVRQGVASMMPDIARTSHQFTLSEVSRGGTAARALGRR